MEYSNLLAITACNNNYFASKYLDAWIYGEYLNNLLSIFLRYKKSFSLRKFSQDFEETSLVKKDFLRVYK